MRLAALASLWAAATLPACGLSRSDLEPSDAASDAGPADPELFGAPLVFAPTSQGFGLNAVLAGGPPSELRAQVRAVGESWSAAMPPSVSAGDVAEWSLDNLRAGAPHEYRIVADRNGEESTLATGTAVTRRPSGSTFSFALLTDSHVSPRQVAPGDLSTIDFTEQTLLAVARDIAAGNPDFMVNLGDMLDFHMFGFNLPPPDGSWTRLGYLNYRRLFGDTLGNTLRTFP
jgi:hypothetical protein